MSVEVPLAWKNLIHDRRKLMVALAGIAFAVMLMFQQRGFNHALFDSTVEIVRQLDGDIILINPARFALSNEIRFPRGAIDIAASHPEVLAAEPLYIENVAARLRREGRRARPIRVLAFDLDKTLFLDADDSISSQLPALREPNTAIMDRLSKRSYGFDLSSSATLPQSGELSGHRLNIIGFFQSGRDFAHEGNLIMSLENFVQYFGYRALDPRDVVDLGVIKLRDDSNADTVVASLQNAIGGNVRVMTRQQLIDKEIDFWARNTPIGVIFTIGALMGFVVGVIICYQILANDISEHMGEFATLKAMGYRNPYFFGLVIRQAIYLAIMGFIPGLVLSWLLFQFNSSMTGLLMHLTLPRIITILVATILMCVVSGLLALRKLLAADPASLF
ncbi:MAG: ABC transporter permease DevC [Pirellulaceae bacterium]